MASRKLRHYFQECSIIVALEVPLNDILNNRDATGRIAKWAIELLPFNIIYKPRRAIKSQVLADFVAERTEAQLPKEYGTYSNWIMHFDGSKMLAGLGAGVVFEVPYRRYSPICTPNYVHGLQQCNRIRGPSTWPPDGGIHGHSTPGSTRGLKPRDIPNKWRLRRQRPKNGSLSQCRTKNVSSVRGTGVPSHSPRK